MSLDDDAALSTGETEKRNPEGKSTPWIVILCDDGRADLDTLVQGHRDLGADVDGAYAVTGAIRCTCPRRTAGQILGLDGVGWVEAEATATPSASLERRQEGDAHALDG
ncbi:hypothetical protein SAE02_61810 [Skermanella aerolata]|uniref:Uncharacterized protein n=1 Tax=Skermanella aerolata TaxID=393310 RepID=A0A512DZX3_9PROT|nr:hypothetical protein [Skermanella aerolata]KJB91860.1 hypothetical protein N826_25425 [Skermanella aerolata KACC 11604]GEO42033.1 hypothetical protein SAE02_61810 [Skermanella aerolata]